MAVDRRPRRPSSLAETRCHGRGARPSVLPWAGGACLAFGGALLAASLSTAPREALGLAAACVLALLLGREVAIPAGLLLGADPWVLAAQLLMVECGAVLVLAPRISGPQPPSLVASAARRRNAARRPGGAGSIYVRAMAPFAFLGPLVATLMGEAARVPPRRLLVAVLAATATAVLAWTALFALVLHGLGRHALEAALAVAVPLALLGATVSLVGSRRGARAGLRS
jgi:hypothetical protein